MQTRKTSWKKTAATLLLGLFAFILAEKNAHGHQNPPAFPSGHEQVLAKPAGTCPVCEFQLAAEADLPVLPAPGFPVRIIPSRQTEFIVVLTARKPALPAERGPPAMS